MHVYVYKHHTTNQHVYVCMCNATENNPLLHPRKEHRGSNSIRSRTWPVSIITVHAYASIYLSIYMFTIIAPHTTYQYVYIYVCITLMYNAHASISLL